MAAITAVLAVLLMAFCGYRWKREYAGLGKGRTTFLLSFGIVVAYYAVLVIWFWQRVPQAIAPG